MTQNKEITQELLPCPNPWCHRSASLPPVLSWSTEAYVECSSCGMQGPSVSPVVTNDDGEQVGTRDAEAEAITAWNTRPPVDTARVVDDREMVAQAIYEHWQFGLWINGDKPAWVNGGNSVMQDFARGLADVAIRTRQPSVTDVMQDSVRDAALEAIISVRGMNAGDFKRSGAVWEAYDQAVLDCHAAVEAALTKSPVTPDLGEVERLKRVIGEAVEHIARSTEHIESWAQDHSVDEATTETWAILHCNRAFIASQECDTPLEMGE